MKSTTQLNLTRNQLNLLRRAANDKHGHLTWGATSNLVPDQTGRWSVQQITVVKPL
jgi:hypothetical protein